MPEIIELGHLSIIDQFSLSHHSVARMYAVGMADHAIRERTGYSTRRLGLLLGSPSFQELIAHYRQKVDDKWNATVDAYLDLGVSNMIRAEAQIAEHLDKCEDTGELLPVNALDKISQGRADRFGYSKHSVHHHEHDFATALDRAIARSGKGEAMKTIEGKAEVTQPPSSPPLPAPQGTDDRALTQTQERVPLSGSLGTQVSRSQNSPPVSRRSRSFASVLEPVKRRRVA